MEITQGQSGIEAVTMSEILGLDTWNQARSSDQLKSFIDRRHEALEDIEIEE